MKITRRSFLSLSTLALFGIVPSPDDAAGLMGTEPPKRGASLGDAAGSVIVEDVHGNAINQKGLALVDWDGYIANPAVKFFIRPAPGMHLPATVILTASEPRLYFDLPSDVGANGPRKKIETESADKVPVFLSIFPDRQGKDRDYSLNILVIDIDSNQMTYSINIHVFDQDTNTPSPFTVWYDFSLDETGFFHDLRPCDIVRLAVADWTYFVGDMHLDPVAAGAEDTWIYNADYSPKALVKNSFGYTGFLMYFYGVRNQINKSGGFAQAKEFQTNNRVPLQIVRSGGVQINVLGNYNELGFSLSTADSDWWKATNLSDSSNELLSLIHHESGHSLFFHKSYPVMEKATSSGVLDSDALIAYHGCGVKVNSDCHFAGEYDDDSGRAVFGSEYGGFMPPGRWLITKLDILAAETVGYKVRKTFDLAILTTSLPHGEPGVPYQCTLKGRGGIPWYQWSIGSGDLPTGLSLDSDSGVISGTPAKAGGSYFQIKLTDTSEIPKSVTAVMSISVGDTKSSASHATPHHSKTHKQ